MMTSEGTRTPPSDGPSRSVQCTICNKKFSRTDHLRRHQLRHTGVKPYSCVFCNDAFTRSDSLREHYLTCSQRGGRDIPEAVRGGRRSHACDSCTAMKLGCDGEKPCKTCLQKKIECTYSRLASRRTAAIKATSAAANELPAQDKPWPEPDFPSSCHYESTLSSDRGSISFLLNSGTASFVDNLRTHQLPNWYHSGDPSAKEYASNGAEPMDIYEPSQPVANDYGSDLPFSTDWSSIDQENLWKFLKDEDPGGPPQDKSKPRVQDPVSLPVDYGESLGWDFSIAHQSIVDALLGTAMSFGLEQGTLSTISEHLNLIFSPFAMTKFIHTYFEFWNSHCMFIHQATFDPQSTTMSLLAAMTIMGGLASQIDYEIRAGRQLLDLVEAWIFSLEDLSFDGEIRQSLVSYDLAYDDTLKLSPHAMDHLRAAFIITIIQYWAGNKVSGERTSSARFSTVVKIARSLRLNEARHKSGDVDSEMAWIEVETRIRTMTIIAFLDCSFAFYANLPPRLTTTELRCDLPCENTFFITAHPFSVPNFTPCRGSTINEAFQQFFEPGCHPVVVGLDQETPVLNFQDMFLVAYLLFVCVHVHVTHANPMSRSRLLSSASLPSTTGYVSNWNFAPVKFALARWKSLWFSMRANYPEEDWAKLGFFKNAYNYWLMTQLIVHQKGAAEVLMRMDVPCEDTLAQYRTILREDEG